MSAQKFQKYIDYIKNVKQPCKVDWFNDDWLPVGSLILTEMEMAGLVIISDGVIHLKD